MSPASQHPMTSAQRLEYARTLAETVRRMARETILPRYLRAVREQKADGSVLTEADLASQAALVDCLPKLIMAPVLGEEMTAEEQGRVWHEGVNGLWVIDPIDGTTNFANGIPFFGVAVAYLVNHKTQIGVVYNPVTDEAFYAGRGAGAWLNDIPLPMRQPASRLKDAVAGVDFKRISHHLGDELAVRPPYYSQRNFGSSALEWCYVAAGRLDVYLHGGQMLWDYAAGRLILEEAGGSYSTLGGTPLTAGPAIKRSVIAAASPALFEQWRTWLHAHS
ncbi:inositol monophosphatase family protein [Zoogloea sp.]|uniref:inositol monophosphatase family protein n=1 Tax=Zoogloea sp. TaxID=49181 RepID=UPI0037DA2FAF